MLVVSISRYSMLGSTQLSPPPLLQRLLFPVTPNPPKPPVPPDPPPIPCAFTATFSLPPCSESSHTPSAPPPEPSPPLHHAPAVSSLSPLATPSPSFPYMLLKSPLLFHLEAGLPSFGVSERCRMVGKDVGVECLRCLMACCDYCALVLPCIEVATRSGLVCVVAMVLVASLSQSYRSLYSFPIISSSPPFLIPKVCSLSLSVSSFLECDRVLIEWVALVLWNSGLVWSSLMISTPLSSILMPFGDTNIASLSPFTAVCGILSLFSWTFGTMFFVFPSWWQFKGTLNVVTPSANRVLMGIRYPLVSFMEHFLILEIPLISSGTDVQDLSVLQGSSSRLIVFSAIVAESVILRVTLDAADQEASEFLFVFRALMVCFEKVYLQSILFLTRFWWSLSTFVMMYSFTFGCTFSSFIEFET